MAESRMSSSDAAAKGREQRERERTPEQQARYEQVSERARLMQEKGLPQPKSGIWGGKAKEK